MNQTDRYDELGLELETADFESYSEKTLTQDNVYNLEWFEIMTYRGTKYVLHGVGQHYMHIMDWRGCNFFHGRLPFSPVFPTIRDALRWLWATWKRGYWQEKTELIGCHSSPNRCYDRECLTIHMSTLSKIESLDEIDTVFAKEISRHD